MVPDIYFGTLERGDILLIASDGLTGIKDAGAPAEGVFVSSAFLPDRATESAYFTRLEPFRTSSPKSLWASLATGKLPYRHGVTGRFSYRTPLNRNDPFLLLPSGVGFRAWGLVPPVERISGPRRRCCFPSS